MSHSFDGETESTASVEQIHAALVREDYWQDRVAADAATAPTLDSLSVDADGAVTVCITQHLGRQLLPGPVANVVRADVKLVSTETWTPDGAGQVRGRVSLSVSGGLGACRARTWLAPTGNGSRLRFSGRVQVKIPLVGGTLEKAIGANLAANIPGVLDFTTTWIAEHTKSS